MASVLKDATHPLVLELPCTQNTCLKDLTSPQLGEGLPREQLSRRFRGRLSGHGQGSRSCLCWVSPTAGDLPPSIRPFDVRFTPVSVKPLRARENGQRQGSRSRFQWVAPAYGRPSIIDLSRCSPVSRLRRGISLHNRHISWKTMALSSFEACSCPCGAKENGHGQGSRPGFYWVLAAYKNPPPSICPGVVLLYCNSPAEHPNTQKTDSHPPSLQAFLYGKMDTGRLRGRDSSGLHQSRLALSRFNPLSIGARKMDTGRNQGRDSTGFKRPTRDLPLQICPFLVLFLGVMYVFPSRALKYPRKQKRRYFRT